MNYSYENDGSAVRVDYVSGSVWFVMLLAPKVIHSKPHLFYCLCGCESKKF